MRRAGYLTAIFMAAAFFSAESAAVEQGPRIIARLDRDLVREGSLVRLVVEVEGEEAADCALLPIEGLEELWVIEIQGPRFSIRPPGPNDPAGQGPAYVARFDLLLLPLAPGRIEIPPLGIRAQGSLRFFTPPLALDVLDRSKRSKEPRLEVGPAKDRCYLFERVQVEVELFLDDRSAELLQSGGEKERLSIPWIAREAAFLDLRIEPAKGAAARPLPLEQDLGSLGFSKPQASSEPSMAELKAGLSFFFPRPGLYSFPSSRYFARLPGEEAIFCESSPWEIEVLPLPEEGRPRSATNGVGSLEVDFEAAPRVMALGETLRLTFSVKGEGNWACLEMPGFEALDRDFHRFGAEDELLEKERRRIFHLSPKSLEVREIPRLAYSWFDPKQERYQTESWGPVPITVEAGEEEPNAAGAAGREEEIAPILLSWESEGGSDRFVVFSLVLFGLSAGVSAWAFFKKRKKSPPARERRFSQQRFFDSLQPFLSFHGEAGPEEFSTLLGLFLGYLAGRLGLSKPGLAASERLGDRLKEQGVPSGLAQEIERFLRQMEKVRYAPPEKGEFFSIQSAARLAMEIADRLESEAAP